MRRVIERLTDILDAVLAIDRHCPPSREAFEEDELVVGWFVLQLMTIGEACRHLPAELLTRHPEVPWSDWIAMRHILAHQYFRVDRLVIWRVVQDELPRLTVAVHQMIAEIESGQV